MDRLEELAEGLIHAAKNGSVPRVGGDHLVIPGWGFELCIRITPGSSLEGFINGTDGG